MTEEDRRALLFKHMSMAGVPDRILREYGELAGTDEDKRERQLELISEQREWLEERIAAMQQTLEYLDCWIEDTFGHSA